MDCKLRVPQVVTTCEIILRNTKCKETKYIQVVREYLHQTIYKGCKSICTKLFTRGARVFAPNYLQGVQVKYFRYTGAHAGAI
jgi:hypothetical protein